MQSINNWTNTPLTAGSTYTGTGENVAHYPSTIISCKTDTSGIIYLDYSPDGQNWDSTLTFNVSAGVNEVHRVTNTRAFVRCRFYNSSALNQTYIRLQVLFGNQHQLTSGLNSTVQADADSIVTRPIDYALQVSQSEFTGTTSFNKFGRNESVGTTLEPVAVGGLYPTPTALTSLEILSSSANDTSAGSGARTVYVEGIGTGYAVVTETVTMNGTTAVALANQYYRIYRMYVATSGTYASSTASSHAGTITVRVSGGGATWCSFGVISGLGRGQTQIAAYTVPANKTLYISEVDFSVESGKAISILMFQRQNIDDVTVPYSPMRTVREYTLAVGTHHVNMKFPLVFPEKTDVGFMANTASGTGALSVQMDGTLVDN